MALFHAPKRLLQAWTARHAAASSLPLLQAATSALIRLPSHPPARFRSSSTGDKQSVTVREALNAALDQAMERDPNVCILGEEVAQYQGAYKITKGLWEKYGTDRVVDTPITEQGFAGLGVGAAFASVGGDVPRGGRLRPVVEFMTWNFAMQAIDQIVNSAAKTRYMSAGKIQVPIVFRGPNGAAAGVAGQHSQDYAAWYSHVPGLKVLMPYDAEDAKGLLTAAILDDDPVCVLEDEIMYGQTFQVDGRVMEPGFTVPIGQAKVMRAGRDVTVVAMGRWVGVALRAAEALRADEGVDVEVVNLRTVRPMDEATILESVMRTHHCVTVEGGFPQNGVGAEICARVMESEAFDYLDAPCERITGADVVMPYAKNLEARALPSEDDVKRAVRRQLQRPGVTGGKSAAAG